MASGTDPASEKVVSDFFDVDCVSLELADPRFYHLDTAFCALPSGEIIYYPAAFTHVSRLAIEDRIHPFQLIALGRDDANRFAANLVTVGRKIFLSSCSSKLRGQLEDRNYTVIEKPLDVFQQSGGSACCLTLRTDHTILPSCRKVQRDGDQAMAGTPT